MRTSLETTTNSANDDEEEEEDMVMMRTRGEYEQEEQENTIKASISWSYVEGGDNIDCMEDE